MLTDYITVAVNTPFNDSYLTYLKGKWPLEIGQLVTVPLGKRNAKGCVIELNIAPSKIPKNIELSDLKEVVGILSDEIYIPKKLLTLYRWVADYYHYPLGQFIFDCLPKILTKPHPLNYVQGKKIAPKIMLSNEQEKYIALLKGHIGGGFSKWLLHGVTGSGKTIIYLSLIQDVLNAGKSVLFLLPEINLTPQFLRTFQDSIDGMIYSYNSSLAASDKFGLWKKLLVNDAPKVIIGVRSSINLPLHSLGLIIVDEEHDLSFKQEDRCPYHARDMAIKRASVEKIPIILGSATPSLETYYAHYKSDTYLPMRKRILDAKLPTIEMIDLREKKTKGRLGEENHWPFTEYSLAAVKNAICRGEQVLCFVNRLGFASFLQCRACGHQFSCPNCSTKLKYYKYKNKILCHYCDYQDEKPDLCPECGNLNLLQMGFGTEKIQKILQEIFPDLKIERFDRDDIKNIRQLEERLNAFKRGEIDILVGTQMLSKGHNFERVNLVLIFGIDSQLNFPDFRSNERVYQLLTQVSGRSGRFSNASSVLIHSVGAENKIFDYIKKHAFDDFYGDELDLREQCICPPFNKLISVYITAKKQDRTIATSELVAAQLKKINKLYFGPVEVLGPRPGTIEKRVNKFTWSILLRSDDLNQMHNLLRTFKSSFRPHYSVSMKIDVDPCQIH